MYLPKGVSIFAMPSIFLDRVTSPKIFKPSEPCLINCKRPIKPWNRPVMVIAASRNLIFTRFIEKYVKIPMNSTNFISE
jgi:hypothetical protein